MDDYTEMQAFKTNDGVRIGYLDTDPKDLGKEKVVLLHGFTGSSQVFKKNVPALARTYRVIVPDLRGHGDSDKPAHGYHVSRLAMDLRELLLHVEGGKEETWRAIGGSLGCAILWSYAELFSTQKFSHMVFIDQSPLQNSTLDGWDARFCNSGLNSPSALAALQTTLALAPATAHKGTIASCLGYRYSRQASDTVSAAEAASDEAFFLGEAMKGDPRWLGKLMEDHTSKDWRDSIAATFGPGSGSRTRVLVVASERSGCFPVEGMLKVVGFVNGGEGEGLARGKVVGWGGHWCYWEDHVKFDGLVGEFLGR